LLLVVGLSVTSYHRTEASLSRLPDSFLRLLASSLLAFDACVLVMARQPAIQGYLSFPMTLNTESHFKPYALDSVHGFNLSVALTTGHAFSDVALVIEEDKLRDIIQLYPWYRNLPLQVLVLFPYFRVVSDDVLMTVKTFFHRRDPRKSGARHIGVTELTGDRFHPRVNPVAKGDRLFRTQTFLGGKIEKIEKKPHENNAKPH
jgi:hypothetical protein